jgi:hypothetical protein
METFISVTDYDNYAVSNMGSVINKKGIMLKSELDRNGYFRISLSKDGVKRKHAVHRLVALAFIENIDNKLCVDHIDGNRQNNDVSNLRWATKAENQYNKIIPKNSSSGVKGVCFDKKSKKWKAHITIDEKHVHIGYYSNLQDAKIARYDKAVRTFGEYMHESEELTDLEKTVWSLMRYELFMKQFSN